MSCIKILITGGACAGKSSSLKHIRKIFFEQGYNVYIVNEMPTILITNGVNPQNIGSLNFLKFMVKAQIEIQKRYEEIVLNSKKEKNIIIFDGCPLDAMKFISKELFNEIIYKLGISYKQILKSYDGIIHLEPVAKKFPELYTTKNNIARANNEKLSIERDNKLFYAYKEHPRRKVVESYEDFDKKMEYVIQSVNEIIEDVKYTLG